MNYLKYTKDLIAVEVMVDLHHNFNTCYPHVNCVDQYLSGIHLKILTIIFEAPKIFLIDVRSNDRSAPIARSMFTRK